MLKTTDAKTRARQKRPDMVTCATCQQQLPDDPNEVDQIVSCRYCKALFCSAECEAEHREQAHPLEAVPAGEEEEERR
jgi:uncharacterized CHY-type Zn-finger protein